MRAQQTKKGEGAGAERSGAERIRAESIFRALNRRAAVLSSSDDTSVSKCLSASASAMIADSLCRLTAIEPEGCSDSQPAATPDGVPLLRLVGGLDDEA